MSEEAREACGWRAVSFTRSRPRAPLSIGSGTANAAARTTQCSLFSRPHCLSLGLGLQLAQQQPQPSAATRPAARRQSTKLSIVRVNRALYTL